MVRALSGSMIPSRSAAAVSGSLTVRSWARLSRLPAAPAVRCSWTASSLPRPDQPKQLIIGDVCEGPVFAGGLIGQPAHHRARLGRIQGTALPEPGRGALGDAGDRRGTADMRAAFQPLGHQPRHQAGVLGGVGFGAGGECFPGFLFPVRGRPGIRVVVERLHRIRRRLVPVPGRSAHPRPLLVIHPVRCHPGKRPAVIIRAAGGTARRRLRRFLTHPRLPPETALADCFP